MDRIVTMRLFVTVLCILIACLPCIENMEAEIKLEKFLQAHKLDHEEINVLHLAGNRVHREVCHQRIVQNVSV